MKMQLGQCLAEPSLSDCKKYIKKKKPEFVWLFLILKKKPS